VSVLDCSMTPVSSLNKNQCSRLGRTGNGGGSTLQIPFSRIALPHTSSVLRQFAFILLSIAHIHLIRPARVFKSANLRSANYASAPPRGFLDSRRTVLQFLPT